ncbi:thiamine pyrophosphate-binding protein [Flexibacterium corallicola]|uniref:thiamine pyrophosphate-binding protein n=1 Tax=Flexibacterium corallicola TaxID=3037259 RepID=UPI00286F237E|nr:thiamine pyrophosphate-binding protein [Pseudovibrio sp. M1P-2-3]
MIRGADLIAQKLHGAGCLYAFGIPGGEVLALMDALGKSGIKFILTKHENSGGFMGEGVWHAMRNNGANAPAILLATLGPGVANAINVIANALQDKVPIIFLSGCVEGATAQTYTHQIFDHRQLLSPLVKASYRAEQGSLNTLMDKAIHLATSGEPGPVHIDVPISIAEGQTTEIVVPSTPVPSTFGLPFAADLDKARHALKASRRPLMIAGVDAVNSGAGDCISQVCKTYQIPLITTYKGKGLMDENHPLSMGGAGLSPKADEALLPLIEEADLVLLVGYDPIEMRINWRDPWPASKVVVEISPFDRLHGMHSVSHSLKGDIATSLVFLTQNTFYCAQWPDESLGNAKTKLSTAFKAEEKGWGPATIFHELRRVMPKETVITADSGAHRILVSQIWACERPRTALQSSALCTMACALPIGAGYKLAAPEVPVLVFVGDAGLEMGLGELATLRDQKLPVIICVLVDTSLALIEKKQRACHLDNLGVDFEETDFAALADVYGGYGARIQDASTLRTEAQKALTRNSFTILACKIDRQSYDNRL